MSVCVLEPELKARKIDRAPCVQVTQRRSPNFQSLLRSWYRKLPELPEVETVRRGLNRLVKGKVISKVEVTYAPMIKTGVDAFCQDLIGQEILDVDRRGKYLLIYLTDHVLISHLRMEGKYNFFADQVPANKHFHAFLLL